MIEKIAVFLKKLLDWFKSDRCFVSYFIKALPMTNNLSVLALMMLSMFIVAAYVIIAAGLGIINWISVLVMLLLSSSLAAGLFYIIKTNVDNYFQTKQYDYNSSIKRIFEMFYTGIGEHCLAFVGIFLLFMILPSLFILGTVAFIDKFLFPISDIENSLSHFFAMLAFPNQIDIIMQGLEESQKSFLKILNRSFLIITQVFSFLIMVWIPEVLYTRKNAITSLFTSIKKIILDFPNAICVYLTVTLINCIPILMMNLLFIIPQIQVGNSRILYILKIAFAGINFALTLALNILSLYLFLYSFYAIFVYYNAKLNNSEESA